MKPKEYTYKIKKYTKYNGEIYYEATYNKWEAWFIYVTYNLFYPRPHVFGGNGGATITIEQTQFPTLGDVQIAIDKHKQEQLEYVQNQIKSVETVKLPQPWKNRIDKDTFKRDIDTRINCESKTQCKWSSDSVCKSNCRDRIFKDYQSTDGSFNDLGTPPQKP